MKTNELKHDPQEDDPKLKRIINTAEKEADAELHSQYSGMGYCHLLWGRQKEILKEKYGIDWRTPVEMNPSVMFD